ncbi:MAG: hypothetical protein IJJ26_09685 [Victivallales bacterium]|nr:hypothetical protein [Victivallales bacterium]
MKNSKKSLLTATLLSTAAILAQDAASKPQSLPSPVRYEDFGAKGDGKTDDHKAIIAAHDYANVHHLPVKADDNAVYYIGDTDASAIVKTNVDFGKAKFIIDDSKVSADRRNKAVFQVLPEKEKYEIDLKGPIKTGQKNIGKTFPGKTMIILINDKAKHFIRYGANQNKGDKATDCFLVDEKGNVDPTTPIVWDFENITTATAYPLDDKPITLQGGHFTTIANQAPSKYTYYSRGIQVFRPNTIIRNVTHLVTGEGDHGAPYRGFYRVNDCANVVIQDCIVTGHRTYRTIGSAGRPVSMGTYDLSANRSINVAFINLKQSNSIMDSRCWGVLATNYCKNLLYENCTVSRFDAHCGVCNATIRNSEMGHAGINLIGFGTFLLENSKINGRFMLNLRSDYGSFWRGNFIIRNCTYVSRNPEEIFLIGGNNSGKHNFGYECKMPTNITIDGLVIDDKNINNPKYQGPCVFANFNKDFNAKYKEDFPYIRPKQVTVKNVKTTSGKPLRLANDLLFFQNTKFQTLP